MTNEELKEALFNKTPVTAGGINYQCVSAIIYRVINKTLTIQVELLDKNNKSVTITKAEDVQWSR